MTRFDTHPTEDEQRLAHQLAILARSRFGGIDCAVDAIGKALALNRIQTVETVLDGLRHLTPMEFGGKWLYKQSVIETVEGAVEPW